MAAMAASLMCWGVAKWGSPAPKSTSFAPWARSLAASAVTAMVAEISIRPIRSEKSAVAVVVMSLFFQILVSFGGRIGGACAAPFSAAGLRQAAERALILLRGALAAAIRKS